MRRWIIGLAVLLFVGRADAAIEIIVGPTTLPTYATNWHNSGLQIIALQDVTLDSFVFRSRGLADTISLRDSGGGILETYSVAGGDNDLLVDVDWQLSAYTTYRLIGHDADGDNLRILATGVPSFPVANSHLQVDGTFHGPGNDDNGLLTTQFWAAFTNLQTDDDPHAVPEPSTLAIWGLLGLCAIGRGWRRRRSIAD